MTDHRHDESPDWPTDADLEEILASLDVDDVNPSAPPASLWNRIASEIANGPAASVVEPTPIERSRIERRQDATTAQPATSPSPASATPPATSSATSRSSRFWLWAAAAAAIVVVAGSAAWFANRPDNRVVATARLEYESDFDQAGATAAASASLIQRDGNYLIKLHDSTLPTELGEPADLELWLIADNDGTLDVQPVAMIDQGDGTYAVPTGLNPTTHNIVDISIEPRDGDAAHSGRSILRGKLVSA